VGAVFVASVLYSIVGNMVLGLYLSSSGVKVPFFYKGMAVLVWNHYKPLGASPGLDRFAKSVGIAALLAVVTGFLLPALPF
jgi:hypothetical protein